MNNGGGGKIVCIARYLCVFFHSSIVHKIYTMYSLKTAHTDQNRHTHKQTKLMARFDVSHWIAGFIARFNALAATQKKNIYKLF